MLITSKGGEVYMSIIVWLVFGAIAGSLANFFDKSPSSGGILGSMVLGIIGALVGGFLANMIFGFGITGFNIESLIVAVLGSLLLLFGQRALRRTA